jgi:C1A family cysteine protease
MIIFSAKEVPMFKRYTKPLHSWLYAIITLSFFLTFASFAFASQEEIDDINNAIKAKGAQWTAGETSISKLSKEERKMRLGLIKPNAHQSDAAAAPDMFSSAMTTAAPASFDWKALGYVTPVRDQGNCGSCWAFATTAALESNLMSKGMIIDAADCAEQILVSCSGAGSCSGGYIDDASDYIRNTGLPPESYYPYTATNGACRNAIFGWQNNTSVITSWHYVGGTTSPTVEQIKNDLVTYGPLVTTMDVYTDFFSYSSGIYKYATGHLEGGHAILIVGYDDVDQYFIVKNSWGSGWGESGYFKIAYSELSSVVYFGDWTIAYYTDTTPPSITVSSPNSGAESWEAGTTKTIQWSFTGNPGSSVRIDLYKNSVIDSTITSSVSVGSSGSGSYSWKIPLAQQPGNLYKVKVTSTTSAAYSDASDNYFTITAPVPPSITVTAPNNGESWKVNTNQQIRWNYNGNPGTYVKIDLMKGASIVKNISSKASIGTGGSGSYTWKVPVKQATGNDYSIMITSTSNSSYNDTSDFNFSIIK